VQDEENLIAEQIVPIRDQLPLTVRISQHPSEEFWRVDVASCDNGRGYVTATVAPGDSFMMNLIEEAVSGQAAAWRHLAQWGHANLGRPGTGHRARLA
jgi:hypothetical protein